MDFQQVEPKLLYTVGAATVIAAYFVLRKIQNLSTMVMENFDFQEQSIKLEDGSRQSPFAPKGEVVATYFEDVTTLHEGFMRGVKKFPNNALFGTMNKDVTAYEWITYKEGFDRAQQFGSGLTMKGIEKGAFVGIYSQNIPEWVIAEQGCLMFSMVVVPLYATLGDDAVEYIINHNSLATVLVDTEEKAKLLLQNHEKFPILTRIIIVDTPSEETRTQASNSEVELTRYADLLKEGEENLQHLVPPAPHDLATICYTSGTTGPPKGVMITHRNLIADTAAMWVIWDKMNTKMDENDVHVSYLPLAHMYERIVQAVMFQCGARVGFFRGDVKLLMEDLLILKPTMFPGVPRLLNRLYDKVMDGVNNSNFIKRALFNFALSRKLAEVNSGIVRKDSIWDKLVFSKIHNLMGGRVRFMVTGSAPLSAEVFNFCRAAFGCYVS